MPPEVSDRKVVLVTGINGFIASRIGMDLLEKGYRLRGTVRQFRNSQSLLEGAYKAYASDIEIYEVKDFTVEGCFREAVRGVHAIVHTASPMNQTLSNPDDFTLPATKGSLNILRDASTSAGSQLSIVLFTSSIVTMLDPRNGADHVYSESDHGDFFEQEAQRLGAEAPSRILYVASKVAAEKVVWQYKNELQPRYSICTIHPGAVIGPSVQLSYSPSLLPETLKPIWSLFSGEAKELPRAFGNGAYCDVRDVAHVHLWCIEHAHGVSGERFVVNAGQGLPQALADVLHAAYPERKHLMVSGNPQQGYNPDFSYSLGGIDGTKAVAWTGMTYIQYDQAVKDTAQQMEFWLAAHDSDPTTSITPLRR